MVSAFSHLCLVFLMFNSRSCSESRAAAGAWGLDGGSPPGVVTTLIAATEEGEPVAGAGSATATELGFGEGGRETTVEKVSGEDNAGGDMNILLLDKFRVLLGLHRSNEGSGHNHHYRNAGFAPAPAPAVGAAAASPAQAPLIHRAHRFSSHPPSKPRPGRIPLLQSAQARQRNESFRAILVKIVIAVAVSVGSTLLVIGLTFALLRRRSRLNKKVTFAGDGGGGRFAGSKMSSTHSGSQQKVSPSPTQELFHLNPAMVSQVADPTTNVAGHVRQNNISRSSPLSRCRPMCSAAAAACGGVVSRSSSSYDGNESFHSVCNSGSSTARSSGASNESLLPEHPSSGLLKPSSVAVDSVHFLPREASPSHHHSNSEAPPAPCCSSALQQLQPNPVNAPKPSVPPPPPPLPQKMLSFPSKPPHPPHLPSAHLGKPPPPPPLPFLSPAAPIKQGNVTPKPPPPPPLKPSTTSISGQPPPPAPPGQLQCHVPTGKDGSPLAKLKPLHWDKVRAAPERAMVWDKIRSNSFELDEEMIESLFSYNLQSSSKTEETIGKNSSPSKHVLEPKRSQNFTILLKALNATDEQVCEALMRGTGLCARQLEALSKIVPTKDEERKLLAFEGDNNELGPAEKFMKAILTVPFSFSRIDVMLFKETFGDEVLYLRSSFQMLEEACQELRSSHLFMRLLEAVLKTGNRMNVGTIRGGARAFKLDALLKLADVKGTDGKTTLLHFVVQEVIRSEGASAIETNTNKNSQEDEAKNAEENEENYRKKGLELVSGLSSELCNVKKTAGIDLDTIVGSVSNLSDGIIKLKHLIGNESLQEERNGGFVGVMISFRNEAEVIIKRLKEEEDSVLLHVKETTEYFHGDVGKEEANPLRIFVIVRDFLSMLDQVCKELTSAKTRHSPNRVIHF